MVSEREGRIADSTYPDGSIVDKQAPKQHALLGEEERVTVKCLSHRLVKTNVKFQQINLTIEISEIRSFLSYD